MRVSIIVAMVATAATALPSSAKTIAFSGTLAAVNTPASPIGRCAPDARTVTIAPINSGTFGISNLGAIAPTQSHCIKGLPGPYDRGRFVFDFGGGDTLIGTYFGALSFSGMRGVFDNMQTYRVTDGTGRFDDAGGAFSGIGTLSFPGDGFAHATQTFSGSLNVPEPAGWMLLGTGLTLGFASRRKSKASARLG
jgi:hypothetical protein